MSRKYSKEISNAFKSALDKDGWHYSFDRKSGVLRFDVSLRGKLKSVPYVAIVNEHDYTVYAISPLSADRGDTEKIKSLAEFICRANYGLREGNFELDFNDGELRFKCFVNCKDTPPSKEMVDESIHCCAAMFTRYGEGILRILFNDMSAKDAVDLCEGYPFLVPPDEVKDEPDALGADPAQFIELLRSMRATGENLDEDELIF